MKGNNQNNYDRRPIRRKDKYNPYTLHSIGSDTDDPHYYVSFVDIDDKRINVEVSKDVFDAFEQFELDDLSHFNEVTNHYDGSNPLEEELLRRSIEDSVDIADLVLKRMTLERVHMAISLLTDNQKRRINMYFYHGLNYEEIALLEGCKPQAIYDSISRGLKKIKKFLKSP